MLSQPESNRAKHRRTLADIAISSPPPEDIYQSIVSGPGWRYTSDLAPQLLVRDRALISFLYLSCCRAGEIRTLERQHFVQDAHRWVVTRVPVEKKRGPQPVYRTVWLPLRGRRAPFTELVLNHLAPLAPAQRVFPLGPSRIWQLVKAYTGQWPHYYRAIGENWLIDRWRDPFAVASYLNVHPNTLTDYARERHRFRPAV